MTRTDLGLDLPTVHGLGTTLGTTGQLEPEIVTSCRWGDKTVSGVGLAMCRLSGGPAKNDCSSHLFSLILSD